MVRFNKVLFLNFKPTKDLTAYANELVEGLGDIAPRALSVVSVVERIGVAFLCRLELTSHLGVLKVVCGSAEAENAIDEARRRVLAEMASRRWGLALHLVNERAF